MGGVYVRHGKEESDIGFSAGGNIYWHDGHVDMPGQHWKWVDTADGEREKLARQYSAAPKLSEMTHKQLSRADRALFIYQEARQGRFYDLEGGALTRLK